MTYEPMTIEERRKFMEEHMGKCPTCCFAETACPPGRRNSEQKPTWLGDCHRFPPTVPVSSASYVSVTQDDWCGEHRRATDTKLGLK